MFKIDFLAVPTYNLGIVGFVWCEETYSTTSNRSRKWIFQCLYTRIYRLFIICPTNWQKKWVLAFSCCSNILRLKSTISKLQVMTAKKSIYNTKFWKKRKLTRKIKGSNAPLRALRPHLVLSMAASHKTVHSLLPSLHNILLHTILLLNYILDRSLIIPANLKS